MIKLTGDKVAVQPLYDRGMTPTGLYIPDEAIERCDQGIVVAIGPAVKDVMIGDHVVFTGYDGSLIALDGEGPYIILEEFACQAALGAPTTVIPGLYFKDSNGQTLTVTYEAAMQIIAKQLAKLPEFVNHRFRYLAKSREAHEFSLSRPG